MIDWILVGVSIIIGVSSFFLLSSMMRKEK
jgi:hypothetical protein